ncbi:unnamed protein product [Aspergillus oryzae]|nr:unnamed protein product [Aspergillus oryzae]
MSSNQSSKKHPQWMKPLTNPDKKSDPSFGGAALGAALYSANHECSLVHVLCLLQLPLIGVEKTMVVECIESVRMIWDRGLSQALPTMIASSDMDHFRLFVRAHIE